MMYPFELMLGLAIAIVGPLLTLGYLRRILLQVLEMLCPAPGSGEFWWRVTLVLAVAGSVLLTLLFGVDGEGFELVEIMRRALLLTTLAIFVSVALVASRIWKQITQWLVQHPAEKFRAPMPRETTWQETAQS